MSLLRTAMRNSPPSFSQDLVPGLVAVIVVELLEMIDVEHRHRQRRVAPLGQLTLARQGLLEILAIEQPGERIANGLDAQLLAQLEIGEPDLDHVAESDNNLPSLGVDIDCAVDMQETERIAVNDERQAKRSPFRSAT